MDLDKEELEATKEIHKEVTLQDIYEKIKKLEEKVSKLEISQEKMEENNDKIMSKML